VKSAMVLLEEGAFLARLADLYDTHRTKGTVYLQMKRFAGRLASVRRRNMKRQAEAAQGIEPKCLVRARTNDKKTKISCVIGPKETVRFQLALGNVMRLHMDGLKRREKKKQEDKKKTKLVKKDMPEKVKPPTKEKEETAPAPTGGKEELGKKGK